MSEMNQVLLILHFLGMALGLSASITNVLVVGRPIAAATPSERAVLARVPHGMLAVAGATVVLAVLTFD